MQCANPRCCKAAQDIQTGTLRMMEMELPPEERVTQADGGFPVLAARTQFFWLCAECSRTMKMKRWTSIGLVLEANLPDASHKPGKQPSRKPTAYVIADSDLQAWADRVA